MECNIRRHLATWAERAAAAAAAAAAASAALKGLEIEVNSQHPHLKD